MEKQYLPLGMVIGKMMKSVVRIIKKRLEREGIKYSLDQLVLLHAVLRNEESIVQQDIAERMGKDKSVILHLVDSLEDDKLIQRIVNEEDRRKNNLIVTEKGSALIAIFYKIENELQEYLQKGLTDNEMNTFFKVIAQIQSNANSEEN